MEKVSLCSRQLRLSMWCNTHVSMLSMRKRTTGSRLGTPELPALTSGTLAGLGIGVTGIQAAPLGWYAG